MHDREVVAAIVAGDPAGLAEAYDRYATPLYSFCRTMLREPADAADAVQDTFVIAAPRVSGLRDPDRLRSWLYAVARNECHRRLRSGSLHASIEEAPEVTDEAADVATNVERADLRALVRDALGGPDPGEGVAHQGAQFRLLHARGHVGRVIGHLRRLLQGRVLADAAQPAVAFVAGHRVQPGPQPVRVPEPGQPGDRDDERVLHGVSGIGGFAEHRPAVAVQRCGVPVVRRGEPRGVACHDGRDDLTVAHPTTVVTQPQTRTETDKMTHSVLGEGSRYARAR